MKRPLLLAFSFLLSAALVRAQSGPGTTDGNVQSPREKYAAAFSLSLDNPTSRVNGPIKIPNINPTGSFARELADSSKAAEPPGKRTSTAIAETIVFNFFVWWFDQYVNNAEYSYISLETMEENLAHWFEWDPDGFIANFFGHPIQGCFYFNAGRDNGMNFWESSLLTFGGGLMWELGFERQHACTSDLIITATGGVFVGEAMYRASSLVLDNSARGIERVWREIAAGFIDPMRVVNRLIFGEATRTLPSASRVRAPFDGELLLGGSAISESAELTRNKTSALLNFDFVYGEPFKENEGESRKPYDYFALESNLRFTRSWTYIEIEGYGLITGKELVSRTSQNHLIGIFQDHNFIHNEAIEFCGTSVCGGTISRFQLAPAARLTTTLQLGWVMLSATGNPYVDIVDRHYNYGTGWMARADATLDLHKLGFFLFRWEHFGLTTIEGVAGKDRLDVLLGQYTFSIWRGLGLGVQYTQYLRNSDFDNFPDIKQDLHELRVSFSYRF